MRRSKLYKQQREQLGDNQQRYSVLEAIGKLKALPGVKFEVSPVTAGRATIRATYNGKTKTYLIN